MRKFKFLLIFILLVLIKVQSIGQNNLSTYSIPIIEIRDSNLCPILDSFISFEESYYDCINPFFIISVLDSTGTVIQLRSGFCQDTIVLIPYSDINNCGILIHKQYRFLITGRSRLSSNIANQSIKYATVYKMSYATTNNDDFAIDDSFIPSVWTYKYINKEFVLVRKFIRSE